MKSSKPKRIIFVPCFLAAVALATLTLVQIGQNQTGTSTLEIPPVQIVKTHAEVDLATPNPDNSELIQKVSFNKAVIEQYATLPNYKSTNLVGATPQPDTNVIRLMFQQTAPGTSEAHKLTLQAWIPELFDTTKESSVPQ